MLFIKSILVEQLSFERSNLLSHAQDDFVKAADLGLKLIGFLCKLQAGLVGITELFCEFFFPLLQEVIQFVHVQLVGHKVGVGWGRGGLAHFQSIVE